jgi:hypothetical protein
MLFDDSEVLSADELKLFDAQALAIAQAEGVTLDGEAGLIRRVVDECGAFLLARANSTGTWPSGRSSWLGIANVTCGFELNQIVVGGGGQMLWSPLRSWIAQRILAAFYQTVQNSSKGEQYRTKAQWFSDEAKNRCWPVVEQSGLPCVRRPLGRPGAARTANSGDWTLNAGLGGSQAGQYDVALAYVRQSDGAESSPSELSRISLQAGQGVLTSITSLRPPTGATHWNVYCGVTDGTLRLQNREPIALGTKTYSFTPATDGPDIGTGQTADFSSPLPRAFSRA